MDVDLAALQRDVAHLMDRAAVLDCIAQHARGCDRHDVELLSAAYHADGIDEHGDEQIEAERYATWINGVHAATSSSHLHHVTTHTCEIDGDEAHAESYVLVTMLSPDERNVTVMCGRYIDRLERRDGSWRIAVRRATVELAYTADGSLLQSPFFTRQHYLRGTRGQGDLSYERPCAAGGEHHRW